MPFKPNSFFKFNVNHYDFFINLRDLHKIFYTLNYINAGGTKEDLAAGLNAAVLICGGPGMAYSALALDLFDQYTAE